MPEICQEEMLPMSLNAFFQFVAQDFSSLQQPPMSTVLILLISLVISLVTTIANRMVINMEEYKKFTIDSTHLRQELMSAMKGGNQRHIAKLQKQQQDMMKVQQKMTMDRMKIMLFFFIPFILIWQVLGNFFQGNIAVMPFEAPYIGKQLSVGTWYIFCSVSTNIVVSRVFGLTFEIEPRKIEFKKT